MENSTAVLAVEEDNQLGLRTERMNQLITFLQSCIVKTVTETSNWCQHLKTQWLLYIPPCLTIGQSYVQPTQCIYVLCVDVRTNSDYFPIQHQLTDFYNRNIVFTAQYGLSIYI